jgi:5'-nucleotidase
MTFILTNDDGIDAPGINALQKAITGNSIIVAPKNHLSGCGHQLTTHKPINVEKRAEKAYAIDGTPADCSRIAIRAICKETKWVLSGINAGGNLGVDVYISGTVAAVREAAILGIPGIAISHWIKRPLVIDWDLATQWTQKILAHLFTLELPAGCFWNVNLPHISPDSQEPEIIFCKPSIDPLPTDFKIEGNSYFYEGEYAKRKRTPNTDVDVCFNGNIAVTMLKV